MISYGGNLYAAILSDNPFLMLSINSAIDVISSICSNFIANHFGRRKTVLGSCTLSMISYLSSAIVPKEAKILFLVALYFGRFSITIAYNAKFLHGTEIFPTVIRSRAISTRMAIGSSGSLISPLILTLGKVYSLIIFGVAAGAVAIGMLFLPETLDQPLPQTMMDTEDLRVKRTQKGCFIIYSDCGQKLRNSFNGTNGIPRLKSFTSI